MSLSSHLTRWENRKQATPGTLVCQHKTIYDGDCVPRGTVHAARCSIVRDPLLAGNESYTSKCPSPHYRRQGQTRFEPADGSLVLRPFRLSHTSLSRRVSTWNIQPLAVIQKHRKRLHTYLHHVYCCTSTGTTYNVCCTCRGTAMCVCMHGVACELLFVMFDWFGSWRDGGRGSSLLLLGNPGLFFLTRAPV